MACTTFPQSIAGFSGIDGVLPSIYKRLRHHCSTSNKTFKEVSVRMVIKGSVGFRCTEESSQSSSVLALPNFSIPFLLETDASGVGIGAVLSQQGHPLAFFSKPFCPKLLHSFTYVRELFAITAAVKKWHQYLLGHPITILTDHRSLKELMSQTVQTLEQQMYLARLIGYDYSIQYRSGKTNVVIDALSRMSEAPTTEFLALSVPQLTFLQTLKSKL